jgi:hypothetical protein
MRMCLQPCKSLDLAPSDRSEMSAAVGEKADLAQTCQNRRE